MRCAYHAHATGEALQVTPAENPGPPPNVPGFSRVSRSYSVDDSMTSSSWIPPVEPVALDPQGEDHGSYGVGLAPTRRGGRVGPFELTLPIAARVSSRSWN